MKLTTIQSPLGQVWAMSPAVGCYVNVTVVDADQPFGCAVATCEPLSGSGSMRLRFSSLSRLDAGGQRVTLQEVCERMEAGV